MRKIISICLLFLSTLTAGQWKDLGLLNNIHYSIQINENGAILKDAENSETIYLGKSCDVYSPEKGKGKWGFYKNSPGLRIMFDNGEVLKTDASGTNIDKRWYINMPATSDSCNQEDILATVINSLNDKEKLLGIHLFSLQWISWEDFGKVTITDKNNTLYIKGSQEGKTDRNKNDFISIDGIITSIQKGEFAFFGKVITKVSHIADGQECIREGNMTFSVRSNRTYWRLNDMSNPCDGVADYIDIFFKKTGKSDWRSFGKIDDLNYNIKYNKHGAILKESNSEELIYLGKDCDAYSKVKGKGSWSFLPHSSGIV